jgi:hypothetical protein
MTVPVQIPVNTYVANGVTTVFPYTYLIIETDDITVMIDGVKQVAGFTVAGEGNQFGGNITITPAPGSGKKIILLLDPPLRRVTDYQQFGDWLAENVNPDFDRIWLAMQAQATKNSYALAFPISDGTPPATLPARASFAGKFMVGDTSGNFQPSNGTGNDAALRADIAAPSGSNLQGFDPGAAGAVASNTQTKLRNTMKTPEDKGAVGDGVADDTAAITNWLAQGGKLYGGVNKVYRVTAECPAVSNTFIDWRGSSLKITAKIRSAIAGIGITNFRMWGSGEHDQGQTTLPTYTAADYGAALYFASCISMACYFENSSDILILDCKFKNLYTCALGFYNCSGYVDVVGNKFTSPAQAQNVQGQHVMMATSGADFSIIGNKFINARPSSADFGVVATYAAGTTGMIEIAHNVAEYCGRNNAGGHQLGTFSFYNDSRHAHVHHNKTRNNLEQVIRLTATHNVRAHHNYMHMSDLAGASNQIVSVEAGWQAAPTINISSMSVANPTVVTTAAPHGLSTGSKVFLRNVIAGNPAVIDQALTITSTGSNTFTVPINVTVAPTASTGYVELLDGAIVGSKNIQLHHNTYVDNYSTTRFGMLLGAYDAAIPLEDIIVHHETFIGMQSMIRMAGPFKNVQIKNNVSRGINGGGVLVQIGPGGGKPTYDHGTNEANAPYRDFVFQDNVLHQSGDSAANPLYLNLEALSITSQFGKFDIIGNKFISDRFASAICVAARFSNASVTAKYTLRGNHVDNYLIGYDASNVALYTREDNETVRTTTGIQNSGTITREEASGNNYSVASRSQGVSTLAAGTVTVLTGEVLANENINLTRILSGGALGHLSVGTIVPGVSFVINSSSGTETSNIYWEIRH